MEREDKKYSINYFVGNISSVKKNFEKNNTEILERLRILEKEYDNMKEVLSTPNPDKIMPELYYLIKKYDEEITQRGLYFNKVFSTIIEEYDIFSKEIEDVIRREDNAR